MKKIISFVFKYLYALAGSIYLFTFGFLNSKNRDLITAIGVHFGYGKKGDQPEKPALPVADIPDVISGSPEIRIFEPAWKDGNVSLLELMIMNQLVKSVHPRKIFEMGTFDGRTVLNLAANCGPEAVVYTLDLPREKVNATGLRIDPGDAKHIDKDQSGVRYHGNPEEKKIVQLYGDTAVFDFEPYRNAMDFVFIDAAHSYEYVMNDSKAALDLLKNRKGLILWHDYGVFPGVTHALNELHSEAKEFRGMKQIKGTSLVFLAL